MRSVMKKGLDKKVFRRTAQSVAKANLVTGSFRGGIRL